VSPLRFQNPVYLFMFAGCGRALFQRGHRSCRFYHVFENLKQRLSSAHSSARDKLNATETTQAKLTASESSWKQQKDALEKEVADLNLRYEMLFPRIASLHPAIPESRISPSRTKYSINVSTLSVLNLLASDKPRNLDHLPIRIGLLIHTIRLVAPKGTYRRFMTSALGFIYHSVTRPPTPSPGTVFDCYRVS
jgi:hypothetical protein